MRYLKRVQPSNKKPEFVNDDTIEIDLPNQIIDVSSLNIYYQASVDAVQKYQNGNYLKRFMPRLSQSVIQELSVFIDNKPVQQIKEFNFLFNILNDGFNKYDEIDGDKHDNFNYYEITDDNRVAKIRDFDGDKLHTYNYFIDKYLGFLNNVKILDCRKKTVKIVIKLAPKWITYRGVSNGEIVETTFDTDYKYRIRNVFANIDIISPDEYVQTENEIVFEDFTYMKGMLENDKNTFLILKHKGSINYMLSTFMDADRETDTGLQITGGNEDTITFGSKDYYISTDYVKSKTSEYTLNNSLFFKRNGLNIKNCQYKLNGQDITPLMSITEIFNLAKDFFNNKMERVKSITSFQNEFFCMPFRIGQVPDDMISEIEWTVNADNKNPNGGTGIMFISYDKSYKF